jgi:hypothetical protein
MSTVEQLGDRWPKVLKGLGDARVSQEDVKAVVASVNSLTLEEAKRAVPSNFAHDSGQEQKVRRDLYRAAHCLWYLAYRSDKSLAVVSWGTFHDTRSPLDALRTIIQDHLKKALGRNDSPIVAPALVQSLVTPQPTVVVRTQFNAVKSFQNTIRTVRGQVHAQRQQAITPAARARKFLTTQNMVSAFQAQGQIRQETARVLLDRSKEAIAHQYFLKLVYIHLQFTDQKLSLVFNFTAMASAVETAYKGFNKDVEDGQKQIAAKVAMAKRFFDALKKAPPPFGYIGTLGSAACSVMHVDSEIDQRQQHVALGGDAVHSVVAALKAKFTSVRNTVEDKTRVGPKLQNLPKTGDLHAALHELAKFHYDLTRARVEEVCKETFGESSEQLSKNFRVFLDSIRTEKLGAVTKTLTEERLMSFAMAEIDNLHRETVAAIQSLLNSTTISLPTNEDLVGAVELMLYGSYVLNVFRKEDKRSDTGYTYDFSPSLPEKIVVRLASASTEWAVLAMDTTKKGARTNNRLKWENRDNHKRALCYFFEWFSTTMNPFLMIAGVCMDGKPVTAQFIKAQMVEYITKLNKAIAANAKKQHILSIRTTWNWDEIDIDMGRATRYDPDSLNAELVALRARG